MKNVRNLSILVASLALSGLAMATDGNNGGGNGGCGVGQQTNGCGTPTTPVPPIVIVGPVGPQGPKGDTGAPGATGAAGRDGKDGVSITGATGASGTDGQSIKGDKGDRGETGANAPDAVTVQQMTSTVAASQAATQVQINGLRDEIHGVAKAAYSGVAAAMALQMPAINPNKVDALTMRMGVGTYKGSTAVGISFRRTNKAGDWSVTGGVASTSSGTAAALGIEHSF